MRTIMVLNAKGGSGKSTLATNLASYYANQELTVLLADFDRQGSSMSWLAARPPERPVITGVAAWKEGLRPPRDTERLIMDAPSGARGKAVTDLVRRAQTLLIPVLPSPIDIRAATDFIQELLEVGRISREEAKLAVVANRVRETTLAYQALQEFLEGLDIPFITSLRDTQNYIRAAERGLGIFDLPHYQVEQDLEQWEPLIKWLNSKRSMPG